VVLKIPPIFTSAAISRISIELKRMDGGCAKENIASRKVLEAIGMKHVQFEKDGSPSLY
jgi:RimJ/RimL family protein N-acetyltransferase